MAGKPRSPESDKSIYFDAPTGIMLSDTRNATSQPQTSGAPPDPVERDNIVSEPHDSLGWLPAADFPPDPNNLAPKNTFVRSPSPVQGASGLRRSDSRRSLFISAAGNPIEGATFIGGAATTGPHSTAQADQELTSRAATADASLTPKQRSRIARTEAKDGKRLAQIIQDEGRAEKEALGIAINELSGLQKLQAAVIKNEAKAQAERAKVLAAFQKEEARFLTARAKYEAAQTRLTSEDESMEVVRNNARDATEKLQEKSQEVDSLRTMFAVDERERAAKLMVITGKQRGGGGCIIS